MAPTKAPPPAETGPPARRKGTRDPEATRQAILAAGRTEFAERGLGGGRIDAIAERAGCNKAMIYHYFGSKEALFTAVLEHNYALIRSAEAALALDHRNPAEAMETLVGFSFDYVAANPEFIKLINEENLHGGVHIRHSAGTRDIHNPLVGTIAKVLARGTSEGVFRDDANAVHVYISVASICYFFIANRATLTAIFGLTDDEALLAVRRAHAIDVIMGYLRPL